MESRPSDPHRLALDPSPPLRAQPRRPPGQRRGRAVEGQRGRGHQERPRVDQDLRHGQLNPKPGTQLLSSLLRKTPSPKLLLEKKARRYERENQTDPILGLFPRHSRRGKRATRVPYSMVKTLMNYTRRTILICPIFQGARAIHTTYTLHYYRTVFSSKNLMTLRIDQL